MNRHLVALIHAGYWTLYLVLLGLVLSMVGLRDGAAPLGRFVAAWPVVVLAVVPNAAAFYTAYWALFSRFLARRQVAALLAGAAAAAVAASALGLALAYGLFGADQPAFSVAGETVALALSLAALAGIHIAIALVMRGFVGWYADITVKEELTRKTHAMELALIRSRLDPHFLFNTLNNIDVLISRDPRAASRYLNQLSDIMRFILYEAKGDAIPLTDELSYIEKYMALEGIRTKSPHYATHAVVGDPAGLSIAPMTFIPFIENAFKHTEGLKGDGAIVSRIAIDGARITFECTNRCQPHPGPAAGPGGLGHELIRQRLHLLYPQRHSLEAGDRAGTYSVRLTIDAR